MIEVCSLTRLVVTLPPNPRVSHKHSCDAASDGEFPLVKFLVACNADIGHCNKNG